MIVGAVYAFAAMWGSAAVVLLTLGRPFAAAIVAATAATTAGAAWALTPHPGDVTLPTLHWPGLIRARCRLCDDTIGPIDSPEVGMWCDTVEAHYAMSHQITPNLARGLDAYRVTVMMHAQLAADAADSAP